MRALLDNGMLDIKKIIKIILLPRPWSFNLRSCYLNSLRILPKLQRIGDAYSQHTLQWPRFTGCASPILHCQISCHHLRFRNEHLKGHGQGRIRRATLIQSYLLTRPPIPPTGRASTTPNIPCRDIQVQRKFQQCNNLWYLCARRSRAAPSWLSKHAGRRQYCCSSALPTQTAKPPWRRALRLPWRPTSGAAANPIPSSQNL